MAAPELYSEQLAIACTAELNRTGVGDVFQTADFFGYLGFDDQSAIYPVEEGYLGRFQAIASIDPEIDFDIAKAPFYESIGNPDLDAANQQLESIYATLTESGGWSQTGDAPLEYWIDSESEHIVVDFTTGKFARQKFENMAPMLE